MTGGDSNTYFQHSGTPDYAINHGRNTAKESFSVDLEPLYEYAESKLTGGREVADNQNSMIQGIEDFIQSCETEGSKLMAELGTDIEAIAAFFVKIAPALIAIDEMVSPFLKSSKATAANAQALAILGQVSSVANAVNNSASKVTVTPAP